MNENVQTEEYKGSIDANEKSVLGLIPAVEGLVRDRLGEANIERTFGASTTKVLLGEIGSEYEITILALPAEKKARFQIQRTNYEASAENLTAIVDKTLSDFTGLKLLKPHKLTSASDTFFDERKNRIDRQKKRYENVPTSYEGFVAQLMRGAKIYARRVEKLYGGNLPTTLKSRLLKDPVSNIRKLVGPVISEDDYLRSQPRLQAWVKSTDGPINVIYPADLKDDHYDRFELVVPFCDVPRMLQPLTQSKDYRLTDEGVTWRVYEFTDIVTQPENCVVEAHINIGQQSSTPNVRIFPDRANGSVKDMKDDAKLLIGIIEDIYKIELTRISP